MMNCSNGSNPMKKQKEFDEEENYKDKLSELPDELIINILSFLPIKEAVKTVLIRRLGNLWTLIPTLKFDGSNSEEFAFNVMKFHKNPHIDKFELLNVFFSDKNLIELTNVALTKNPKFLSLKNDCIGLPDPFHLSSDTLTNQNIVSLHLFYVEITFLGEVDMSSLRKLELVQVIMNDDTFRILISGCPILQELVIKYPHNFTKLHFTAPNIDKLELQFGHSIRSMEEQPFSLNCPNLKILHVNGLCLGSLRLIDVSSVQEAKINRCFEWFGCESCDSNVDEVNKLLIKLRNVEFMELDRGSGAYMQLNPCGSFGHEKHGGLIFPAPITYLLLKPGTHRSCLVDIIELLESSPILVEFILYADMDLFCDCDVLMDKLSSPCKLYHIRRFIISEYKKPCKALSQLIAFVLKSASLLEKVDIEFTGKDELFSAEGQVFILQLLSFPRASPKAKVEIHVK